jgi:signal peptidase I
MGGDSMTHTAPRSGGTGSGPVGSRTGQRLSGLAVALGLVLFLGGFAWGAVVYLPYTVPTSSMTPTIDPGDRILAQRVDGGEGDAPMVKRVVAVGGDTVSCCQDGKLKVNGKEIDETYLPEGTPAEMSNFPTVTVPKGRLFLLGDERGNSVDSTAHLTDAASGTVARSAVDARVDAVVWPMKGMLGRPTGFEPLGALSSPGPLRTITVLVITGAVLVLGGGAYGPVAKRTGAARARRASAEPAGVR